MSTKQEEKKSRERAALNAFKAAFREFPDGDVVETEEPDFLVGSRPVGIEVVEYFKEERVDGSPIQEQEALRRQVVQRATNEAVEAAAPPVFATVFFVRSARISKANVPELAAAIVDVMKKEASGAPWSLKVPNEGQLPSAIESIILYSGESVTEPAATTTDVVWVREMADHEIRNVLNAKEGKHGAYRRKCAEAWLLIVVNGFRISSMAQLPSTVVAVASSFDRLFVLHDFRTVLELPVAAR